MRNLSIREFLYISIFPCDPGAAPQALNFNLSSPHPESGRAGLATNERFRPKENSLCGEKRAKYRPRRGPAQSPHSAKHPAKTDYPHF